MRIVSGTDRLGAYYLQVKLSPRRIILGHIFLGQIVSGCPQTHYLEGENNLGPEYFSTPTFNQTLVLCVKPLTQVVFICHMDKCCMDKFQSDKCPLIFRFLWGVLVAVVVVVVKKVNFKS